MSRVTASMRRALALALLLAQSAWAASDPEIDKIREEIRQMKASYEARIQSLEQRLKDAEDKAATAQAAAPPPPQPPAPTAPASSIAAFNPAVSAILNGQYANFSQDPDKFRLAGFAPAPDAGPGKRGFSLGESELAFSANVDHKFSGTLIFSITPDDKVSVEEGYGIFTGAPAGITPKLGRFFSGLGYLNEQHAHAWDFTSMRRSSTRRSSTASTRPTRLQVTLRVAPTDQYFMLGGEVGNGDMFPGNDRNKNGAGSGVLFARVGGDIGYSNSWLAGLSYLETAARDRPFDVLSPGLPIAGAGFDGQTIPLTFTGTSHVAAADFVWKWSPNGNPHTTNFKVQGEYLWRKERGDLAYDASNALGLASTAPYSSRQSGWYLQGVYQWMPLWRVGARFDRLDAGSADYSANAAYFGATDFAPKRYTMMVDYTPSEFSRWRLQFAQAKFAPGLTDNEWFLQYILSIGAHGAHKF